MLQHEETRNMVLVRRGDRRDTIFLLVFLYASVLANENTHKLIFILWMSIEYYCNSEARNKT